MDDFKKYLNEYREKLDTDIPGDQVWEKLHNELSPPKALLVSLFVKRAAAACIILLAGFGAYVLIDADRKDNVARIAKPSKEDTVNSIKQKQPAEDLNEQRSIVIADVSELKKAPAEREQRDGVNREERSDIRNEKTSTERAAPVKPVDPMLKVFNDMQASYAGMINFQLEKVKGTPIYAEDANYFVLFKKQFQDLNNDEKVLKDETKKNGINDDVITRMINIYQEKINLLKQLQFEINKMNNRVRNADSDVNKQIPSYINL